MKTYKENGLFVFFTGLIIAIGRLLFPNDHAEAILILMALISYIAFGFVILFLHISILNNCKEKINKSGIDTKKKKIKKIIIDIFSIFCLFIYLIIGIIYINKYKTSARNDAISIIALSISIASKNLELFLTEIYFNALNLLLSFFSNIYKKIIGYLNTKEHDT